MPAPSEPSQLWPGIFDGDDARCSCSWSYLKGIRQVKVSNAGCVVRHTVRESPVGGADDDLLDLVAEAGRQSGWSR